MVLADGSALDGPGAGSRGAQLDRLAGLLDDTRELTDRLRARLETR